MDNKLNRYVDQTILLVDDFIEFRHALKRMVESMGANHVDLASNGIDAIELYCQIKHDIILLDFNLGEGLNGLQILEELHFKDILRHDTIVILITGETSMEMVQGAIDLQPDDYLPKPFTKAILKKRLDRAFEKNAELKTISLALNQKDYLRAISCCDQLTVEYSKYSLACHRIKADCCLRLGKPNSALVIYDSILSERELSWALLGRARCKVHNSLYVEAINDLDKIIDSHRFALDAYDQKAESLIAIGEYEKAYETLQKAITISPNNVSRQRMLADLASRYQHYDVALLAMRKVINLNRHLSLKQPDDYLQLTQVLSSIHSGNFGALSRRAPTELAKLLKDMQFEFQNDIQLSIAATIAQAIYDFKSNRQNDGEINIKSADNRLQDLPDSIKPYLLNEIKFAAKVCGQIESIEQLYQQYYITNQATKLDDNIDKANSFNRQGMKKFYERDWDAAYSAFKTAYLSANDNVNIALNLMQVMVKLINHADIRAEYQDLLSMCSQTFKFVASNDQRATHFKLLFNNIKGRLVTQQINTRLLHG